VRVHNITDVPTQALKAAGLVCVPLRVGGTIVKPGESEEVSSLGTNADRFIRVAAIHVGDKPPEGYAPAEKAEAPQRKVLEVSTHVPVTDNVTVAPAGLGEPDEEDDEDEYDEGDED
jgi:hypothetical protein